MQPYPLNITLGRLRGRLGTEGIHARVFRVCWVSWKFHIIVLIKIPGIFGVGHNWRKSLASEWTENLPSHNGQMRSLENIMGLRESRNRKWEGPKVSYPVCILEAAMLCKANHFSLHHEASVAGLAQICNCIDWLVQGVVDANRRSDQKPLPHFA
jgi:hypothetical protein